MRNWIGTVTAVGLIVSQIAPAVAQTAPQPEQAAPKPTAEKGDDADQETVAADLLTAIPDPATVQRPDLTFKSTPEIEVTFAKYYYFHRADTSFTEALADIRECDGFARGLSMGRDYNMAVPYPYAGTLAGGIGGAIGSALAVAIFGSAELRKQRRVNMRRCMHYKGYQRFGLEKERWQTFNFEEGLSSVKEPDRQRMLAQQALVASSPIPEQKDLGL